MNRWTQLVHFNPNPGDPHHPNITPIYQTATFVQAAGENTGQYDYTRSGNPTRSIVEKEIAQLENAEFGFAFASGMAALTTVIGLLTQGDHIIASDDLYGGTFRLLSQRLPQRGIDVSLVDTTNLEAVNQAMTSQTRLLLVETPSNPMQKISDIKTLAELAHQYQALFVVDNTFLSPWLQQPLSLGADIVVHSATKHLGGHSDLTAGALTTNDSILAEKIAFIQNSEGCALAPFECWLLLKGLKTLGLRIEREQSSAEKIADYLSQHSRVKKVYYPTLLNHPGRDIQKLQATGGGTIISFETGSLEFSKQIVAKTKLFVTSVSFGSLVSLISLPCIMSHASMTKEKQSFESNLLRLSIGIEDPDDLIQDLDQALQTVFKF